jgi:hypothetical protein
MAKFKGHIEVRVLPNIQVEESRRLYLDPAPMIFRKSFQAITHQ